MIENTKKEEAAKEYWNEQYGVHGTTDPEITMQYLLNCDLHGMFPTEDEIRGNSLYLPAWDATVIPEISQLDERGIVLNFYVIAPQWGRDLFECCVGMGNTPRSNLGMATSSFLFAFMQGIARMEAQDEPEEFETEFAGNNHKWKMYPSNIVGMGKSSGAEDFNIYWKELGEEIKKRLGNQKLCFVKIYGAKMGDNITGECRIDDIQSDELGKKVAEIVSKWDAEDFCSQKQFFFIRQEEETTLPNEYLSAEGRKLFKSRVIEAVKMFHECSAEELDDLEARMAERIGDATLAGACRFFLPEICAQNAFEEVGYAEDVEIMWWSDGRRVNVYKNQLADFYPLWSTLFEAFSEGVFGEETDLIYRELIGSSAIYSVICQMKEKGTRLEDAVLTALLYQVDDAFELR